MTEAQAVEAIFEGWIAGWTHEATISTKFGNEAASASDRWCRVTVVTTLGGQASMGRKGSRRFQTRGYIAVQIFVPVDTGDAELRGLCGDALVALQSTSFASGGETLDTFGGVTANVATDGRWYFATVTVPFMFWTQG